MKLSITFLIAAMTAMTMGRTLIFKEDRVGDDLSVMDSENGPILFRVDRKHFRIGHHATVYDASKTTVATYASEVFRFRDLYKIVAGDAPGTIQQSALFSNSFDIEFNGQHVRAKAVQGDNKYVFEDAESGEQLGTASYDGSVFGFHRDMGVVDVQSTTLPDAFWVDVMAVIHDSEKE